MAAPKLKVNTPTAGARPKLAVAAAPAARVKLNAGAAPAKRPALKGADGKAIAPKPSAAPAPEPEVAATPTPTVVAAPTPTPAPEPVAAPVAETVVVPAPEPVVEEAAPAAEIDAQAAADAAAQAEYERQMEEYNRQMEEYNRQMAEYQAQQQAEAAAAPVEEAPAPAEEVAPAAAPAPAAAKSPVKKKKKTPAPAPAADEDGMSEEQLSARDAYLQQLQTMADKTPFHKTPLFYIGLAALVALGVGCFFYVSQVNAERNAQKARIDATNAILKRAFEINKQQIETMADAQAKGYTVVCSKQDAQDLLNMLVDPYAKDEYGRPAYGANPKATAQLATLLLGLASEMDPEIDNLIFKTLDENAPKMDADLIRTMLQRMAISNNKGINAKFRKLADSVSKKPKWTKKANVIASIWESMGLRVTSKDIPDIIKLLSDDSIDGTVANALSVCLNNVITMEDDMDKRMEYGDEIFETLPEKYRETMQGALGRACSPKALEFYKAECEDPDKWHGSELFFANYYNDDIIPYLLELKAKAEQMVEEAGEDKAALKKSNAYLRTAEFMLAGVVSQNRERTVEQANELIAMVYDKINVDTSGYADTEEGSEERAEMDACFKQKERLINNLSNMIEHEWVTVWLDKMRSDDDPDISNKARLAQQKVKENTAADAALHAKYKSRNKE
ncbi:MAG: hypothetical protein IJ503_02480 [Akkermansia sp.]|nr:hypothetical protein [Akkermansia sp.]